MGLLIDGVWQDKWYETDKHGGKFVRESAKFRNRITPTGEPSAGGEGGFAAEAGRYHLYVAYACPWSHRTIILRALKGLEDVISMSAVEPHMLQNGWEFKDTNGGTSDPINNRRYLHEVYTLADSQYTGRVTVPTLWDKQRHTVVNNESADIVRMFNSAFAAYATDDKDYYPPALREKIDPLNERIYRTVNNGVYRCGFATSQDAYEAAFDDLFETLDELETRLAGQRYLAASEITETDWRLFVTLVRFDAVYYSHFKANRQRIADYPNLSNYLRDLYQQPKIAATVRLDEIKEHYYYSHGNINPTRIVPKGPALDFNAPHDRKRFAR